MIPMVAVSRVTVSPLRPVERSLTRLARATEDRRLGSEALKGLLTLTAMAHPAGEEGDILSSSIRTAVLDELEALAYIRLADDGSIELI